MINFHELLEQERAEFQKKQPSLTKDDIKYISGKDTFKGKFTGFLTRAYYQKEKVIRTGELFYGYVFSEWDMNSNKDSPVISYVLFSPERNLAEKPSIFKKIVENLQQFNDISPKDRKSKKLKNLIENPLSEAPYEEVPTTLSEGHIVFFCKTFRNRSFEYSFNLGLNLFIVNPTISKQILYLPERYMTETFKKLYEERKLML